MRNQPIPWYCTLAGGTLPVPMGDSGDEGDKAPAMSLPRVTHALPLFPLRSVLMPGGPMALRVFEPRYLDMVKRRPRSGGSFGICLAVDWPEGGGGALRAEVGCGGGTVDVPVVFTP